MKFLYLVTHPEATHHVEKRVGGWHDSSLTERGHRRAQAIARHLRSVIPTGESPAIYASDLLRTRQTAEAIADRFGTKMILDARLREKSYGVAEGRPQAWLDERFLFPPAVGDRLNHDEGIEGGELKGEWIRRVYSAMEPIVADPREHRIVVTHGGSASWVIASWLRIPVEACYYAAFRAASGSVTTLEEDDRFHNRSLVRLGETDFG